MQRGRRRKLSADDFDRALKQKNIEVRRCEIVGPYWTTKTPYLAVNIFFQPLYGFCTPDLIPFRFASGGGRELYFSDEREVELNEVISGSIPKSPFEVTLKGKIGPRSFVRLLGLQILI